MSHELHIPRLSFVLATSLVCGGSLAWAQSPPSTPDGQGRSAATVTVSDGVRGVESPLLAALAEAEHSWETEHGATIVPPEPTGEFSWAAGLRLPAIVTRLDAPILRKLAAYRTDAHARSMLTGFAQHATRYRARIESALRSGGLPADLVWVVAAESNFDPSAISPVGAAGLWQLMPQSARALGLRVDGWVDERRDPERSTMAAVRMLRDLYTRLQSWELVLAAYNMGYSALVRSMRSFNTNDFPTLVRSEAGLPYETVHYVPRILATAIALANPDRFNLEPSVVSPPVATETLLLERSVSLSEIAHVLGVDVTVLRQLNPALMRSRTPHVHTEGSSAFTLNLPSGTSERVRTWLATLPPETSVRVVALRFGETLEEIATRYGTTQETVIELSGLTPGRTPTSGVLLCVPDREPAQASVTTRERTMVALETVGAPPADRERVFVRVATGDEAGALASALGVGLPALVQWNGLDPTARLQSGMWLQAWVSQVPANVRVYHANEIDVVSRTDERFLDARVAREGRVRQSITIREGDTMDIVAERYGMTLGSLSRINQRTRSTRLVPGEQLVVYTVQEHVAAAAP